MSLRPSEKVENLQAVLRAKAKASPSYRFYSLYDKVYRADVGFVVAFSCKGRGVRPSCNGRRMAQTAAHLVDRVIPPVPVRQWVISVPKRLRCFLSDGPSAVAALTRIFNKEIERLLCTAAGSTRDGDRPGWLRPREERFQGRSAPTSQIRP
jgi:hypothetical protein